MSINENLKPSQNPLVAFASVLSVASVIWTTYSIVDLFRIAAHESSLTAMMKGSGAASITVALSADIIWGAIIVAQYTDIKLKVGTQNRKFDLVPVLGWIAVLAVVGLIMWHGHAKGNTPMMWGGTLLPLGSKVIWMMALAKLKKKKASDLTDEQQQEVDDVEREGNYAERMQHAERKRVMAEHEAEMDRIRMEHEKEMAKLSLAAEKDREEDRLNAERAMARDENYFEIRRVRAEKTMAMEIASPIIAGELAVPEDISLRKALDSSTSLLGGDRRNVVTLPIERIDHPDGLSPSQLRMRIIAGAWYLTVMNDPAITQREFCERTTVHGRLVSEPDLSKAKRQFPKTVFTDQQMEEAYSEAVGS